MAYSYGSNLLIDEAPLTLQPSLAVVFGLNQAIFLQQLQYWLKYSNHVHNNRKWVYNTYKSWQEQLPFLSLSTIRRIIEDLKDKGIIITSNFNSKAMDRTIWYTIDYDVVQKYVAEKTANIRKESSKDKYVNPETGEEISPDSVPDELKLPLTKNPYEAPKNPFEDDEQSDVSNMSISSVQNEQMERTQFLSPFVQNDTPSAQIEQMNISNLNTPCVQSEHTHLSKLDTAIPLEYTEEYKHKNTTTKESQPQSYPQVASEDDVVVVLKNKFPVEYQLSQDAKVDPKTVLLALNTFAQNRVKRYLEWTRDYVKFKPTTNPTGLFLTAIKSSYNIDYFEHNDIIHPLVPPEVIAATEREMVAQIEQESKTCPPITPDNPLYKYLENRQG